MTAQDKKILIIASWYPSNKSDVAGIFIQEQVQTLNKEFSLTVVHPKVNYSAFYPFGKSEIRYSLENGVPIIRIAVKRSFPIYNQWNFLHTAKKQIKKEIKDKHFDLIHAHVSYPGGVIANMLANDLKIPYLITEHYGGFVGLFRSKIHKFLILRALKNAKLVITVSKYSAEIIQQYTSTQIEVVPNLIDVSKFNLKTIRRNQKTLVAGFLGILNTPVKGLDILLEAIKLLPNNNFKLIIGGDGKLLKYYKELAKKLNVEDRCQFIGMVPSDERFEFFKKLDFLILPSRRESFGVVILEAMASGIPVLATRCGGPEEIVEKSTGLLVEKENPEALAKGIQVMIKNLSKFNPVEIRNRVNERFGKNKFLKRMVDIYNKILDEDGKK